MITHKETPSSSQVRVIEYKEGHMEVTFNSGAKYRYYNVPKEVWMAAVNAESIGKFLNSEIKNKYKYEKI